MSKQLSLSIAVSLLAMISFVLLGQQAGEQLARDAGTLVPLKAELSAMPTLPRFLPILN